MSTRVRSLDNEFVVRPMSMYYMLGTSARAQQPSLLHLADADGVVRSIQRKFSVRLMMKIKCRRANWDFDDLLCAARDLPEIEFFLCAVVPYVHGPPTQIH